LLELLQHKQVVLQKSMADKAFISQHHVKIHHQIL
jgi:hypothetical protein